MSEPFKERAEFFIRNEDFKQGYGFLTKKKKLWEVGKASESPSNLPQ